MRRGDEGSGTGGYSEGQSKATSDAGSELGRSKALTREEREAKYNEARLRIFGTQDPESQDPAKAIGDTDHSRSSSSSGKKKTRKRNDDDDFEPRSQFPQYYANSSAFPNPGYGDGTFYFPQYSGMMTGASQYTVPQTASPPPMMYPAGYASADPSGQMQYINAQQYVSPPVNNGMNASNYVQSPTGNFDLSSQFQQVMSFSAATPQLMAPKTQSPNYAASQQQAWQSSYDPAAYGYAQPGPPAQYPDRSKSSPAQSANNVPYAYGQMPNPGLQNGAKSQHPLPGSFNRQPPQFNPQTQAFIPGSGRSGSMPMPGPQINSPYPNPFGMPPNSMQQYRTTPQVHGMQQRHTPPISSNSTYSSPSGHGGIQMHNAHTSGLSYPPPNFGPPHSAPPATFTLNNRSQQQTLSSMENRSLVHPLPLPPNPESSIAKWGTPSHLPPKPPTPTDPHPHKYIDINKGLPTRQPMPGLSMPRGFLGGQGPSGS